MNSKKSYLNGKMASGVFSSLRKIRSAMARKMPLHEKNHGERTKDKEGVAGKLFASASLIAIVIFAANTLKAETPVSTLSLKSVPVPGPSPEELSQFIRNKEAAIQLGKALFWDAKVGSDNKTACASCHFAAGADNRSKNKISPGMLRTFDSLSGSNPDKTFQIGDGPNHTLASINFPFTRFTDDNSNDPLHRVFDANDVASSLGVFNATFGDINVTRKGAEADSCTNAADPDGFHIGAINTRRVEPRNTPSVINAVFNFRNFWDGRGNNVFNGGDPFGLRNPSPLVWKVQDGVLQKVNVAIHSSSAASQSSGPPLSATEMSCANRTFAHLGTKLLDQRILSGQQIASTDSILGRYAKVRPTYRALIATAFQPAFWKASLPVHYSKFDAQKVKSMDLLRPVPFTWPVAMDIGQMQANFGLFFSLAIQLYESTLVADDSPFDRYAAGDLSALNQQQVAGLSVFMGKGRCINCHGGAELTNASFRNVINERVEKMVMGNGAIKTYDNGFYNIGVRPSTDDIGIGGNDPFGMPLSESKLFAQYGDGAAKFLGNGFDPNKYGKPFPEEVSVNGAFKTPGLRNVELTGPYFHNGGKSTLMQVVDFYNRGGDFAKENEADLAPDIQKLGLTEEEKESLVAFLLSLTDERVSHEKAPFDHPSLCMPNGHVGDTTKVTDSGNGTATDEAKCLNAVGAGGARSRLPTFLDLSPYQR